MTLRGEFCATRCVECGRSRRRRHNVVKNRGNSRHHGVRLLELELIEIIGTDDAGADAVRLRAVMRGTLGFERDERIDDW
jgi:hypothetical protein